MKLINQACTLIEQTDFSTKGIFKCIESCARISYKSEDRITDDSYIKFVNNLIARHHDRPLEFGTVHLRMSGMEFEEFYSVLTHANAFNSIWTHYNDVKEWDNHIYYVTTNYREYLKMNEILDITPYFDASNVDTDPYPKRYIFQMILSRGVMDEFRTHIGLSHLAESTRYCNYSKDKFDNEVTFIIPDWVNTHCPNEENEGPSVADLEWSTAMQNAEASYFQLLKEGWKPQQAREVLPLGVKSELISCGFKDAWDNFFERRCDSAAHPMAKEIAMQMKELYDHTI